MFSRKNGRDNICSGQDPHCLSRRSFRMVSLLTEELLEAIPTRLFKTTNVLTVGLVSLAICRFSI